MKTFDPDRVARFKSRRIAPDPFWKVPMTDIPETPIALEMPAKGQLRARRIICRSAPRPTTKFPSIRLGRSVHCESDIEVETAEWFDACSTVNTFGEQPLTIHYEIAGQCRTHIPDFCVITKDGKAFVEAKFIIDIDEDIYTRTWILKKALFDIGYRYYLVTENETRCGNYLTNARYLLRRGRAVVPDTIKFEFISRLRSGETLTWGALTAAQQLHVARLILQGVLWVPMHLPILPGTALLLPSQKQEEQPWLSQLLN
jgi:hypothetical protein